MREILCVVALASSVGAAGADEFLISITDQEQLAGIAAARAAYNSLLAEGQPQLTDADYIAFVIRNAAMSYAKALVVDKDALLVEKDAEIQRLEIELAAEKAKEK